MMRSIGLLLVCLVIWSASAQASPEREGKKYHVEGPGYYQPPGYDPSSNYPRGDYGGSYPSYVAGPPGPPGPPGAPGAAGAPGAPGASASCGGGNCGVCPAGTAAAWWELDWPGFGAGTDWSGDNSYDAATAETTCGGDLQVGGACELACWYYNAYSGHCYAGAVLSTQLAGWGMTGSGAGTYCSAFSAQYEHLFHFDDFNFFICAALPWKLCCRPPNYPYYPILSWPEPGLTPIVDQIGDYFEELAPHFLGHKSGVSRVPSFAKKMLSQEVLDMAKADKEAGASKNAGKPKPQHITRSSTTGSRNIKG